MHANHNFFGKMRFLSIFFMLVFQSFFLLLTGQEVNKERPFRYLSAHLYGGQIQIHSSRIEYFKGARPFGVGVDFAWKFVSDKAYALCQCYPSLGASLNYWDFGHRALGNGVSGLFFVQPVLFSVWDTDISLKTGLGVSYLNNPYHEEANPLNITYSNHFGFPLMAGLSLSHSINDDWMLLLSGIFQHISNGGVNQPNLGINYVTVGIGIQRKLDERSLPPPGTPSPFEPENGIRDVSVSLIAGLKEPTGSEDKALVLSLSGEYRHQFARINAWTVGGMVETDHSRDVSTLRDKSRISLTAGHAFLLGRFSFAQKAGIYLWRGHATHNSWFQYYTLDFDVMPGLGIGAGLKAHGRVAEFLGLRILYRVQ